MRILAADDISNRTSYFELQMFSGRDDVDYLDLGLQTMEHDRVVPTPWPEVAKRIRQHAYAAAFIGKPTRLWNSRKALWRNAWWLARRCARGFSPFRLGPLLSLLRAAQVPIAGVDLSDTPVIDNSRFSILGACQVFFKRELPTNPANCFLYTTDRTEETGNIARIPFFNAALPKLRPLSVGLPDARFEQLAAHHPAKDSDLFFAGTVTNRPTRAMGLAELQRLDREGFRVLATDKKFSDREYQALAARALVCWSPEGYGFECTRTYEVAALGSVPVLKFPPIIPYAPFRAGIEGLFYTHESIDLYDAVKARFADPAGLEEMGRRAREHVRKHHRDSALAAYMLNTLLGSGAK
jgi:hypothetical protein